MSFYAGSGEGRLKQGWIGARNSRIVPGLAAVASLALVLAPGKARAEPGSPPPPVTEAHPNFTDRIIGFLVTGPEADLDRLQAAASEAGFQSQRIDGPDGSQLVIALGTGSSRNSVQSFLDRMQSREFAALTFRPAPAPSSDDTSGVEPPVLKGNILSHVWPNDYPSDALRAGEEGEVGVRLKVGVKGRVENCSVTDSSHSKSLDAATCRIYMRLRFSPARDKAGQPVVAFISYHFRWRIPRD